MELITIVKGLTYFVAISLYKNETLGNRYLVSFNTVPLYCYYLQLPVGLQITYLRIKEMNEINEYLDVALPLSRNFAKKIKKFLANMFSSESPENEDKMRKPKMEIYKTHGQFLSL